MEKIRLSPRLAAIAALVPTDARAVDVGTDHGYIPVWLVQNRICEYVLATDINCGPLERAAASAEQYGVQAQIKLLLCDGLAQCPADAVDTVIIAGMGGETIAGILERAPWAGEGRLLILQPMSKPEALRRWLLEHGYQILRESLVKDSGTLYPILTAKGGGSPSMPTEAELLVGRPELMAREPLFEDYLSAALERVRRAISGLEKSGREADQTRLESMRKTLAELQEMQRRL